MNDLNGLKVLAESLEGTALGEFLIAITPAARVLSDLIEKGYNSGKCETERSVETYLAPNEFAERLGVSVSTLANYRKKWSWFRPAFGKGKGQRFASSLLVRVAEEKGNEEK